MRGSGRDGDVALPAVGTAGGNMVHAHGSGLQTIEPATDARRPVTSLMSEPCKTGSIREPWGVMIIITLET